MFLNLFVSCISKNHLTELHKCKRIDCKPKFMFKNIYKKLHM